MLALYTFHEDSLSVRTQSPSLPANSEYRRYGWFDRRIKCRAQNLLQPDQSKLDRGAAIELERSPFGAYADQQLDHGGADHQTGAQQVTPDDVARAPVSTSTPNSHGPTMPPTLVPST